MVIAIILIAPIVMVVSIFGILSIQESAESEKASELSLSSVKLSAASKQVLKKEVELSAISTRSKQTSQTDRRYTVYQLLSIISSTPADQRNVYLDGNAYRKRDIISYLESGVFPGGLNSNLHTSNRLTKFRLVYDDVSIAVGDYNPSGGGTKYTQAIYLKNGDKANIEVYATSQGGRGFYR